MHKLVAVSIRMTTKQPIRVKCQLSISTRSHLKRWLEYGFTLRLRNATFQVIEPNCKAIENHIIIAHFLLHGKAVKVTFVSLRGPGLDHHRRLVMDQQ